VIDKREGGEAVKVLEEVRRQGSSKFLGDLWNWLWHTGSPHGVADAAVILLLATKRSRNCN